MNSLRQKSRILTDRPTSFRAYVDLGLKGPLAVSDQRSVKIVENSEDPHLSRTDKRIHPTVRWYCHDTRHSEKDLEFSEDSFLNSKDKHLLPTVRWYCHEPRGSCDAGPDISLSVSLLPGEVLVSHAENVLKFNTFSELKTGVSGMLFCTTFKLSFVTAHHQPNSVHHQNLLLKENDICLTNIDSIYHVSGGRKKKLPAGSSLQQSIEILEVHCRDLRIFTFSFKFSPTGQDKGVINALLHHTPAAKPQLLFLFEYQVPPYSKASPDIVPFTHPSDWRGEMNRTGCSRGWRVTQANETFILSTSMPECFVVPASLVDADLSSAAPSFDAHRVLTWSWGLPTGQALVVIPALHSSIEDFKHLEKFRESVRESHPKSLAPKLIVLGEVCPNMEEIQSSFLKLKELCMPDCAQSFWEQEVAWLSNLEASHWLDAVAACLRTALSAAHALKKEKLSVVLQESGNRDLSCVVSSLTQILLDPLFRSQEGFQRLLEKEWLAMGHPFLWRLGRIRDSEEQESPVFLMFLDCVWQLLQQFPSSFEFSETYLTSLWDSAHISLFPNFMFNNHKDRKEMLRGRHTHNVWQWTLQFSPQDLLLFRNPLYALHDSTTNPFLENKTTSLRPQSMGPILPSHKRVVMSPLTPDHDLLGCDPAVMSLALWSQCYLRWIPLANIVGGGAPVLYLQNLTVADDIRFLSNALKSLCAQNAKLRHPSHRRSASDDLCIAVKTEMQQIQQNASLVTSAFPFSPIAAQDWRKFNVPTASSLCVTYGGLEIEDDE